MSPRSAMRGSTVHSRTATCKMLNVQNALSSLHNAERPASRSHTLDRRSLVASAVQGCGSTNIHACMYPCLGPAMIIRALALFIVIVDPKQQVP